MKVVAVCIARNEEWCLPATARAALRWCDALVVLNHASTDGTSSAIDDLQADHPGRVYRIEAPDPEWREQEHRQRTLDVARSVGASHVAIVDADEMLTENLVGRIRGMIEGLSPGEVLQLPWLSLWRGLDRYRCDGATIAQAHKSMAFTDAPGLCWQASGGYHHHHTHPHGSSFAPRPLSHAGGGWLHLQFTSWTRLLWKQRLYVMREVIAWGGPRANYAGTVNEAGLETALVPAAWWGPERDLIRVGGYPIWQEAECRALVARHGADRFRGHDLFGWDPC